MSIFNKQKKKGFSLVELIVVMGIMAILVLVAVPKFIGHTKEAKMTTIKATIKELEAASDRYYLKTGQWPRDTDIPYTLEELKNYATDIKNKTGSTISLDPEGKYYPIDYIKLQSYVKRPKDDINYILQNPVGEVFYVEGIEKHIDSQNDKNNTDKNVVEIDDIYFPNLSYLPKNPILPEIVKPNIPNLNTNSNLIEVNKQNIPELTDNSIHEDWFLINNNGEAYASDILKSLRGPVDLIIPSEINGVKVTSIKASGFKLSNINQIVVPEGVTSIGENAFSGSSIKYVQLPNSLTTINSYAFTSSSLIAIEIPDSVNAIGIRLFEGCTSLKYVKLSNNLKALPDFTFNGTTNLSVLEIPKNLTSIGQYVFAGWESKQTLIINSRDNTNFTLNNSWRGSVSVIFEDVNDYFCIDSIGAIYANSIFGAVIGPIDLIIPSEINGVKVTSIKASGFKLSNINQIVAPEGVTTIGENAFSGSSIKYVQLPNTLTTINSYAFLGSSLITIEIPDSVNAIGIRLFEGCTSLKYVKLSNNLKALPDFTFNGTTNLSVLEIPKNLTSIGQYVFAGWESKQTLIINSRDNTNFILNNSWRGSVSVIFEDVNDYFCIDSIGTIYANSIFGTVIGPIDLIIPSEINGVKVTSIKASGFKLSNINQIVVPEGVTTIGESAFSSSSIKYVQLPNSLTTIGNYAFNNSSLIAIKIPDSVTSIGIRLFEGDSSLINVKLSNNLKIIPSFTFSGTTKLSILEIPQNITSIGEYVFAGWSQLQNIYFKGRTSTDGISFGGGWNSSPNIIFKE